MLHRNYNYITMIRKVLFTATALLGLAFGASAQKLTLHYGIKAGLDMTSINAKDGKGFNGAYAGGLNAGGFLELNITKKWGLEGDLLYTRFQNNTHNFYNYYLAGNPDANLQNGNTDTRQKVTLNYITIPIMARYSFSKILSVVAGPQYSYLFNTDESFFYSRDAFKKSNLGVIGGVQVTLTNFRFYGRYVYGINSLNDAGIKSQNATWNTSEIQVGIGVTIK